MRSWKKYVKNQKGAQVLEFVAVFPLIIFAFMFIWQMALVAYGIVVTEAAVRDGARAAAVSEDHESAAREAIDNSSMGVQVNEVDSNVTSTSYGEEVIVTLETYVPTINVPFIGSLEQTVSSQASMPYEVGDDDS
ncbi:TadE/TadG family type IV pilus assembly protein [Geomicrobium sp. JCM 19039]|uniref:TadE/TadG family type IV pilus assembly protein n=1 Tax=Geomicrobium sp. JCM 19039 TaxID=1460636 RepID=UPI00045F4BCE|nr:TadE family protein [Geomicrobium sp. JCM 19039]GAK13684.1 hypothetical protein JCM19039_3551 [Geomicrobium sp. JCM 19039]